MDSDQTSSVSRRDVLKTAAAATIGASLPAASSATVTAAEAAPATSPATAAATQSKYNGEYAGERLNRVAFPMGGLGAGMICLEGTAALSHVSLRNKPEVFQKTKVTGTKSGRCGEHRRQCGLAHRYPFVFGLPPDRGESSHGCCLPRGLGVPNVGCS